MFIIATWLIYGCYFLNKTSDGSYYFMASENSLIFFSAFLISSIGLLTISLLFLGYLISLYYKRLSSKVISQLADDLSRMYWNDDFLEMAGRFGLSINYNNLEIKPEVLARCSLPSLARIVALVFYKNQDSLNFSLTRNLNILADQLLQSWTDESIDEFVQLIDQISLVLGQELKYAVERQRINFEVAEFNQSVEKRLEALAEKQAVKNKAAVKQIDNQFSAYDHLLSGSSIWQRWLKGKLGWDYWSRSVTA